MIWYCPAERSISQSQCPQAPEELDDELEEEFGGLDDELKELEEELDGLEEELELLINLLLKGISC